MIKATGKGEDGRTKLWIGLSFRNLDKFRTEPLDTYIVIDGAALGLPVDITLFSAETEGDLGRFLADRIGPDTRVYVDPRFKT